jgi:hypothetical protein
MYHDDVRGRVDARRRPRVGRGRFGADELSVGA